MHGDDWLKTLNPETLRRCGSAYRNPAPTSTEKTHPADTKPNVLAEAHGHVHGDRLADYGHPLDNHSTTADLVTNYLWRKYGPDALPQGLDADDVCWFNVLQKCSRDANRPTRDNVVDVAGYMENLQRVRDERVRRAA